MFNVQIARKGREWLAQELRRGRFDFKQADNRFAWLANPTFAQRLMDEQLGTDWPAALTALARPGSALLNRPGRPTTIGGDRAR
ncbi:MAG TPA: hypothetical protein VMK12_21670 [Anaeromyxobacteraceae bacterium]|nr:hypothetical protein [Anaeromyxobacteraceae bacterium]